MHGICTEKWKCNKNPSKNEGFFSMSVEGLEYHTL